MTDSGLSSHPDAPDALAASEGALGTASVPPFTVSVGIASREPGEVFTEVIVRADEALLFAKSHGRDRVVTTQDVRAPLDELDRLDAERG